MQARTMTVTLPEPVAQKLEMAAKRTFRSIDEILATTVDATLMAPDLSDAVSAELAAMHLLSDASLWAATEPTMSGAQQRRLEQLNDLEDDRTLTAAECAEQTDLVREYQRSMLRRAQALAILRQRGFDVGSALETVQPEGGW